MRGLTDDCQHAEAKKLIDVAFESRPPEADHGTIRCACACGVDVGRSWGESEGWLGRRPAWNQRLRQEVAAG